MGPYAELTITSPYVHWLQHIYHGLGNLMPESTLTLCESRFYSPVRDFGFGLRKVWRYFTVVNRVSVPSSELGPPNPLPYKRVFLPLRPKGGDNTLLRVRGWGDPIRTTAKKAWQKRVTLIRLSLNWRKHKNSSLFNACCVISTPLNILGRY
jgi:hypothetical protein